MQMDKALTSCTVKSSILSNPPIGKRHPIETLDWWPQLTKQPEKSFTTSPNPSPSLRALASRSLQVCQKLVR